MKELKVFTIQFVGLKLGEHDFQYQIDSAFFQHFGYDDFNSIAVDVNVKLIKKTTLMEFEITSKGEANVNCDLTNEEFDTPVNGSYKFVVKFGEEFNDEDEDIIILPHGEYEINIAQQVYETIALSMPNKRVHPGVEDGTLKSEVLEKLEEYSLSAGDENEAEPEDDKEIDPRWAELKKLLTDK